MTIKSEIPADRVTPMMAQYIEIKTANPDCLLFYRMGDFYELFFEDAEVASRALGITLTKRGRHQGHDIPMCGVPVVAADDYLQRLIGLGHRVAVCEQTEDPAEARKRGSKAVVRRDVVRLVTPGTITEETLLEAGRPSYLAALARIGSDDTHSFGLAFADISAGTFQTLSLPLWEVAGELARIEPKELLVSDSLWVDEELQPILKNLKAMISPLAKSYFDSVSAKERLCDYYQVAALEAFGQFSRSELSAAGAIIGYIDKTQIGARAPLCAPRSNGLDVYMQIDAATRSSLEIMRTQSGDRQGSLFDIVNYTVTGAGSRLLCERLSGPSLDLAVINNRLDAVSVLNDQSHILDELRDKLKNLPDLTRALSRIGLGRSGPRDLDAMRTGLELSAQIKALVSEADVSIAGELIEAFNALPDTSPTICKLLQDALADSLPLTCRDGNFVRSGFDADLDDLRQLRDVSRQVIAKLQADYCSMADVKSLKIKYNNVLGYFVDVTANHGERLMAAPLNEVFIHRQTLANAVRFTTTELGELEAKILSAGERSLALEQVVYERLVAAIMEEFDLIQVVAEALAVIDCACGFATLAVKHRYCRPQMTSDRIFNIAGGRHPVVEASLRAEESGSFIANDCTIGAQDADSLGKILILTGPNMAGKSTYLRQNAILTLLAQAGSFVPAENAQIGIVDRLFSRVGAADDLAKGRSTFMVEMIETAAILNQATDRSLVILDEIGRGTATFDGLSIAWAAIEHLHEVNGCRTLFATHYHELTALASRLQRVENATVRVKEWEGDVIFMHEIMSGSADRSYGIQVARLAGLPAIAVERAKVILAQLEDQDRGAASEQVLDDLPLFSNQPPPAYTPKTDPKIEALKTYIDDLNPDELSPKHALEILYELKGLANEPH